MFLQTELCSEIEFYYFTAPDLCLMTSHGTSTQQDSLKSNIFPGFLLSRPSYDDLNQNYVVRSLRSSREKMEIIDRSNGMEN